MLCLALPGQTAGWSSLGWSSPILFPRSRFSLTVPLSQARQRKRVVLQRAEAWRTEHQPLCHSDQAPRVPTPMIILWAGPFPGICWVLFPVVLLSFWPPGQIKNSSPSRTLGCLSGSDRFRWLFIFVFWIFWHGICMVINYWRVEALI